VSDETSRATDHSPAFREALRNATRPARSQIRRVTIRRTDDGLGIHNPTRGSVPLILFLLAWLVGWGAGVRFAGGEILDGAPWPATVFLVIWLAIWTLAGVAVIYAAGWQIGGVERLFIISDVLVTETGIGPFRRRRHYPVSSISNLRAAKDNGPHSGALLKIGRIEFEADGKRRSFGIELDDAERDAVLSAIRDEMTGNEPHSGQS